MLRSGVPLSVVALALALVWQQQTPFEHTAACCNHCFASASLLTLCCIAGTGKDDRRGRSCSHGNDCRGCWTYPVYQHHGKDLWEIDTTALNCFATLSTLGHLIVTSNILRFSADVFRPHERSADAPVTVCCSADTNYHPLRHDSADQLNLSATAISNSARRECTSFSAYSGGCRCLFSSESWSLVVTPVFVLCKAFVYLT